MTSTKKLSEFYVLARTKKRIARTTHMCQDGNSKITYAKMNSSSNVNIITVCCLLLYALALTLVIITPPVAEAIDCFKCSSRNGSNPACEDPFHNLNTTRVTTPTMPDPVPGVAYHTPCYAGKKGRQGLFPASSCIKLTGKFDTTGETLVVRHCALDSGTLTQDTEIARMSHCGKFHFEGDYLQGCVLACLNDACNHSPGINEASLLSSLLASLAVSACLWIVVGRNDWLLHI